MIKTLAPGSLLFHSSHGLCRVKEIIHQKHLQKDTLYYALVPHSRLRKGERFLIPVDCLPTSGFHALASVKQAGAVLEYLKGGTAALEIPLAELAKELVSFCSDTAVKRPQRKHQSLQTSVRGVVGELAIVLDITPPEAALRVRENLETEYTLTTSFIAALTSAAEN